MSAFELVSVNVSGDVGNIAGLSRKAQQVMIQSLNQAARRTTAMAATEVASRYFVTKGIAKQTLTIQRATAVNPVAIVKSRGPATSLHHFRVSPATPPTNRVAAMAVGVKRGEGLKALPHAFVARHRNNASLGVFVRRGPDRLPIDKKYGPSVPGMLKNELIVERMQSQASEWVADYFDDYMIRSLQRGGR